MALGTQQQATSPTPSTIHSGSCLILASVLANTESLRTFVGEKRIVERKIGSFGTYWSTNVILDVLKPNYGIKLPQKSDISWLQIQKRFTVWQR